jgi:hypothetical protein
VGEKGKDRNKEEEKKKRRSFSQIAVRYKTHFANLRWEGGDK